MYDNKEIVIKILSDFLETKSRFVLHNELSYDGFDDNEVQSYAKMLVEAGYIQGDYIDKMPEGVYLLGQTNQFGRTLLETLCNE